MVLASFGIFWIWGLYLAGLIIGLIALDVGVQAAQVANQAKVMSLRPSARNRMLLVAAVRKIGVRDEQAA